MTHVLTSCIPPFLLPLSGSQDALEYGLIDEVIAPNAAKAEKAAAYWLKSGRAESDGRLEQWQEYLELQEKYSMEDQFKKVCVDPYTISVCCPPPPHPPPPPHTHTMHLYGECSEEGWWCQLGGWNSGRSTSSYRRNTAWRTSSKRCVFDL